MSKICQNFVEIGEQCLKTAENVNVMEFCNKLCPKFFNFVDNSASVGTLLEISIGGCILESERYTPKILNLNDRISISEIPNPRIPFL